MTRCISGTRVRTKDLGRPEPWSTGDNIKSRFDWAVISQASSGAKCNALTITCVLDTVHRLNEHLTDRHPVRLSRMSFAASNREQSVSCQHRHHC